MVGIYLFWYKENQPLFPVWPNLGLHELVFVQLCFRQFFFFCFCFGPNFFIHPLHFHTVENGPHQICLPACLTWPLISWHCEWPIKASHAFMTLVYLCFSLREYHPVCSSETFYNYPLFFAYLLCVAAK